MTKKTLVHRPDIDGLRAIAVLSVVLFHYKIGVSSAGFLGVDVFFVISGYLITTQLLSLVEIQSFTKFLTGFYARRIRRIFPALLAVLATSLLFGYFTLPPADFSGLGKSTAYSAIGLANFFFFSHTGYFDRDAELQPLLHMWSLGVEEQFYFVWPALIFLLARFVRSPRRVFLYLVLFTLGGLIYAEQMVRAAPKAAFFLPLPRAWELSAGALLAFCPTINSRAFSEVIGWAGITLLGASLMFFNATEDALGGEMTPVVLGAACLVADRQRDSISYLLSLWPLRWIGLLSFSLYLWHWPVLVFFRLLNFEEFPQGRETVLLIGLTVLLSVLSYVWVETPVRRRGFPFAAGVTIPTLTVVLATSMIIVTSGGLESRLSATARTLSQSAGDFSPRRPECHRTDALNPPLGESCRYGEQGSLPEVAMWSDSHGVELAHALGEILQDQGKSVLGLTYSSCPPALKFRSQHQNGCQKFAKDALDYLVSHPEIHTVIIAAYYELYDQAGSWQDLAAGLNESLRALSGSGKRVVLVASTPEMGFSIPQAAVRLAMLNDAPLLEVPVERHRAFSHKAWDLLQSLVRAYSNVTVFDPTDVLCDANTCKMIVGSQTVLFDADHLTLSAARRMAQKLANELPESSR